MKSTKRVVCLLLVLVLTLAAVVPAVVFAEAEEVVEPAPEAETEPVQPENSAEANPPEEETTTPEPVQDSGTGPAPEEEPSIPLLSEEPVPTEEPAVSAPQQDLPEPTMVPESTEPLPEPEVEPPEYSVPGTEEPWGEGKFEGPNNPSPYDVFPIAAGNAVISVQGCYDSSGSSILYSSSFYWDGRYCGGYGSPRHIIYANGQPAYCLEPGKYLVGGSRVNTSAARLWNSYSRNLKEAIKLALICGAEGNAGALSGSYGSKYTATQLVIWEFIIGARSVTAPYRQSSTKVIDCVCLNGANSEVRTAYNQIISTIQSYFTMPSFASRTSVAAPSHKMSGSGSSYRLTLTDTNRILSKFSASSTNAAVQVSISGNNLTVSSNTAIPNGVTINLIRKNAVSASSVITAYAEDSLQETIVGIEAAADSNGHLDVYTEAPAPPVENDAIIRVIKQSDEGYNY